MVSVNRWDKTALMGLAVFLFFLASVHTRGDQGMASGQATRQQAKPLPKDIQAPKLNYVDVAAEAGLTRANVSGAERGKQYIVETTGNGVALVDYDGDGLLDILLINASRLDAPSDSAAHFLYRNLGGLRFEPAEEKAGIGPTAWGQGVCAGDIDNDARVDLLVTNWGANKLYRNQGGGKFLDESAVRLPKTNSRRWTTGCAFLDYDRDGDLDLFVAHYLDFQPEKTPRPGEASHCTWKSIPVICGPRGLPGESMALYRNDGKGVFTDVSVESGVATPKKYYGFTVLTGDYDNDGWSDVYVACDSVASLLFRNKHDGTFEEVGIFSGAALNEDGREQAGMGATAGDYDGDGLLDIFKTNFSDDTPTLYRNEGNMTFSDVTIRAGLAVNTKFLGWGAAFLDVDHDGRKDIFHVNGHVYPEVDEKIPNEKFAQQRVLYWNLGKGEFHDLSPAAGPAVSAMFSSRGLAAGDLDNDGSLELVVVNMHQPPSLLKNTAPLDNAVLIRALTTHGRDAIGARLTLEANGRKQIDEVRSGGFHISHGDMRVHFGMAKAASGKLSIRWPDGTLQQIGEVPANALVTVQQGKGIVSRRAFERAASETRQ